MSTVFVTGTGTEVGKTFVTAAVAPLLGALVRKPVQSFAPDDDRTDADILAAATNDDPERVCLPHRWLAIPMAPPMAADALGLPKIRIADLARELDSSGAALTLIEGAGGLLSPIAHDGDSRVLIRALKPDAVVIVADAGLGTINVVRLCVEALAANPVVYLNRFDTTKDLHRRNADWLRDHDDIDVVSDVNGLRLRLRELTHA